MTGITYSLTPKDIANYRLAVRDRINLVPGTGLLSKDWVRAIALLGVSLVVVLLVDALLHAVTGERLSLVAFVAGLLTGAALVIAMLWVNHFDQEKKLVRPDGPTFSEHSVSVTTSGLSVSAPHMSVHYVWPIIQAVSFERDLVVLWLEPSVVIPQRAFANVDARDAFVAAVEARRKEASLPRAGSFSQ